jgi:hypothetical protein
VVFNFSYNLRQQEVYLMATRTEVYFAINGERDYQDQKYPMFEGLSASPEGFLLVIEHLLNEGRAKWAYTDTPKDKAVAVDFLRKIAATAVRGMEQHGVVPRVTTKVA